MKPFYVAISLALFISLLAFPVSYLVKNLDPGKEYNISINQQLHKSITTGREGHLHFKCLVGDQPAEIVISPK